MISLRTKRCGAEGRSPRCEGELRDPIAPRMEAVKR
jgi:hypothetical protein